MSSKHFKKKKSKFKYFIIILLLVFVGLGIGARNIYTKQAFENKLV